MATNGITFDEYTIGGGIFCVCIILIFTIAITYDMIKKVLEQMVKDAEDASENTSIDIRLMIYIDLFIILVHTILVSVNFVFASRESDCDSLPKYALLIFKIIRCIMYLIFVRRIQVIYGDTMFALRASHLYILYALIAIYSIPSICYINWNYIDTKYHPRLGCLIKYNSATLYLISASLEIFIAVYYLILFIYPLYKLIASQQDKQVSYKLYNVMIKYFVLYSFSIFSCCVLIILSYYLPFGYNYSIIDGFINGIILILLHPIHNKLYKKSVCCCLHWLCIIVLDAPNDESETIENKNDLKQVAKIGQRSPTLSPVQQNEKSKPSTPRSVIFEWKEDAQIEHPTPIPSVFSDCNDNILMTEIEIEIESNRLTLKDVLSITSLTSFKSVESTNTNKSREFERKRSNTLKFINYESTKL